MPEQTVLKVPTALFAWTIGTGLLATVATFILTRRAEKGNWQGVPVSAVVAGVIAASVVNLGIAYVLKGVPMGEKSEVIV